MQLHDFLAGVITFVPLLVLVVKNGSNIFFYQVVGRNPGFRSPSPQPPGSSPAQAFEYTLNPLWFHIGSRVGG
jgi:hypothetical protein